MAASKRFSDRCGVGPVGRSLFEVLPFRPGRYSSSLRGCELPALEAVMIATQPVAFMARITESNSGSVCSGDARGRSSRLVHAQSV